MKYACICVDETGGRCQESAIETPDGLFFCQKHLLEKPENLKKVPKPERVLVKFSGSTNFLQHLQENYPEIEKKDHNEHALNRAHGEYAESLERNPHRFDKRRNDDGVPVFGKDGASDVGGMTEMIAEMRSCGYSLTNVHWFHRMKPDKRKQTFTHGAVLVFGFVLDNKTHNVNEKVTPGAELLKEMAGSVWQFAHVWANPPRVDGEVRHTVNCTGRQDGQGEKSKNVIKFLEGLWFVLPRETETTE